MSARMANKVMSYKWECSECKQCFKCRRPAQINKMLYCDQCDRGYHIYCIGLRIVPKGLYFFDCFYNFFFLLIIMFSFIYRSMAL